MKLYETKHVIFYTSFGDGYFINGDTYEGTLVINGKGSNYLYFSVLLLGVYGVSVKVAYTNGTWNRYANGREVTVNYSNYANASYPSFLIDVSGVVTGHLWMTVGTVIPARTWVKIGSVSKTPSLSIIVPCCDGWSANYAGLLEINNTGEIRVHLVA